MPPRKAREIKLKTKDDIEISANHYEGGFDKAIIVCPGFLMHKDSKPFKKLSERLSNDFDVVTMDFRGHGSSGGSFTFTSNEGADLKAVLDHIKPKYKYVGIIGFSLGAAVAINETAQNKVANKVMAVSAPTEFKKIENRFLNTAVIASTFKKFDWKMGQARLGNLLLKKTKPIDSVSKISPIPIMFVHGSNDTIIDPKHSKLLYEKAKEPKKIAVFEDSLHAEDIFFSSRFEDFVSLCKEWFN